MTLQDALPELVDDLARFGPLADRIQGLVDIQVAAYRPRASDWIVLPWVEGFYLFSEDSEGQRRGREVVAAFLGPSVVSVQAVSDEYLDSTLPARWRSTGLVQASYLRRVSAGVKASEEMLSRLEIMATAIAGRERHILVAHPSPSDLLRDFRLALLRLDDDSARSLLDQIRMTGHVSAENLRYLRIEYLAAFGRWTEMRALPHIGALLQARRPRAISETLLRMLWWTELAGPRYGGPQVVFRERGLLEQWGPLLRLAWVPSGAEGRVLCFLTALSDDDTERQAAILAHVDDAAERARLESLRQVPSVPSPPSGVATPPALPVADPVAKAFADGRFIEAVSGFLADPKAEHAELAVSAVLDSGATEHATDVLNLVRGFIARGEVTPGRRAKRDLEDLERLVDQGCADWLAWAIRLSGETRWADASAVARDDSGAWPPISSMESDSVETLCDALLEASGGTNVDQLRGALDILCREAAEVLSSGRSNDFCEVVLALLSEQENFSEMVRSAYVDLFSAWLGVGPPAREYSDVLTQAVKVWRRIASPLAVGWAVSLLEAATDSPCPDHETRTRIAVELVEDARQYYGRLGLRDRVEVESLAAELGLPTFPIEAPEPERDNWSTLDGKLVGIYSLLPRVATYLESRLDQLCSVGDVQANRDTVATPAVRRLAQRADYLIVDTWHAAHQATAAIDEVRPRERQIFPRQRGRTGFLRALEEAIA